MASFALIKCKTYIYNDGSLAAISMSEEEKKLESLGLPIKDKKTGEEGFSWRKFVFYLDDVADFHESVVKDDITPESTVIKMRDGRAYIVNIPFEDLHLITIGREDAIESNYWGVITYIEEIEIDGNAGQAKETESNTSLTM